MTHLYRGVALVLGASTRVPPTATSTASSICTCVGASTMQKGRSTHQPFSCSVLCEEAYFASLPAICDASIQRRSARARRIYACTTDRDKQPHRSALASARRPCRRDAARTTTVLMLGLAGRLTMRALRGSVTLRGVRATRGARSEETTCVRHRRHVMVSRASFSFPRGHASRARAWRERGSQPSPPRVPISIWLANGAKVGICCG